MLLSIAAGLGNVFFWGGLNTPKSVLVFIVVAFVIYPVMINTKFEEIFAHFKDPRPIFCSLAINFIVSPLLAFSLGIIFFRHKPDLFSALLIISLLPTSSMSVAWTAFSGAKMATALYLIPLNMLFAAFIGLPFIFPFIMGDLISVDKITIIKNIALVFFMPLFLGDISRRLLTKVIGQQSFQRKVKPNLGGMSAVGVLVLIFLVMSLKRNALLLTNFKLILYIIAPVFLFYLFVYLISFGWTKFLIRKNYLPGDKAVVIIFTSAARHINIAIAIALSTFTLENSTLMILLFIIAYLIQVPSLAIFSQKFGKQLAAVPRLHSASAE